MKLDNAGRCHDAASRRLACEAGPRAIRAALAENDISFSVLPDLTDQDLKDIGVSLGHRRQLLREIRRPGQGGAGYCSRTCARRRPINVI